jgi:hypothetical protein
MALDIPPPYEPQIELVAQAQHITKDEALDRVLDAGLERFIPKPAATIPGLTGAPMSDDDAAVMDEVVEIAMNSQGRRWTSGLSA